MKTSALPAILLFALFFSFGCGIKGKNNNVDTSSQSIAADSEKKAQNASITDGRWKLITLLGQEVQTQEGEKDAFLIFNAEEQRMSGYNGCNSISGGYTLGEGQQLSFTQMISTQRACMNSVESDFMKVLERADNYTIHGDTLSLNKARMAPLARFVLESEE
ncbi:META domain-containing protein [Robertkochia flava]|uniref:META domain-containing protein n=1 Tax=Robertkochia flava TaxID=3447986 RepID=UPI001CCE753D|nr:META domain-containing protein [Robertkochia marina]